MTGAKINPWVPGEEYPQNVTLPGQSRVEKPEETYTAPTIGSEEPTGLVGLRNQAASNAISRSQQPAPTPQTPSWPGLSTSIQTILDSGRFPELSPQVLARISSPNGRQNWADPYPEGYEDAYSAMLDSGLASEDIVFRAGEHIGDERAIIFETNAVGNFEEDEIGIYYPESGDTEYMSPQEYEDLMNPEPQDTGYFDTGDTGGY